MVASSLEGLTPLVSEVTALNLTIIEGRGSADVLDRPLDVLDNGYSIGLVLTPLSHQLAYSLLDVTLVSERAL